jgi:hypothetical protein
MNTKIKLAITAVALLGAAQVRAQINTGAGLYGDAAGTVDPNWTIAEISQNTPPPAGQLPGGTVAVSVAGAGVYQTANVGNAYLVPNNSVKGDGNPLFQSPAENNGPWVDNSSVSSWISYSTPFYAGPDMENEVLQYQTSFTAASTGLLPISYATDNVGTFYVTQDGGSAAVVSTDPSQFGSFTSFNLAVTAGVVYHVDLDVNNAPDANSNPTGADVQFGIIAVPEPTTVISGVLMLLPFGASTLRILRRRQVA